MTHKMTDTLVTRGGVEKKYLPLPYVPNGNWRDNRPDYLPKDMCLSLPITSPLSLSWRSLILDNTTGPANSTTEAKQQMRAKGRHMEPAAWLSINRCLSVCLQLSVCLSSAVNTSGQGVLTQSRAAHGG